MNLGCADGELASIRRDGLGMTPEAGRQLWGEAGLAMVSDGWSVWSSYLKNGQLTIWR